MTQTSEGVLKGSGPCTDNDSDEAMIATKQHLKILVNDAMYRGKMKPSIPDL